MPKRKSPNRQLFGIPEQFKRRGIGRLTEADLPNLTNTFGTHGAGSIIIFSARLLT